MIAQPQSDSAPRPRAPLRRAAIVVALAGGLATATPRAQEPPTWAARSVLRTIVDDGDTPLLRGEAALALACVGEARDAARLRAVAGEQAAAARHRGLLAIGVLGAPGAEVTLGRAFAEADPRDGERHLAAAGLALLPAGHVAPAVDDYLAALPGANHDRESATVAALLAGWTARPDPSRQRHLEELLDDRSFREPQIAASALRALAAHPPALDAVTWAELLERDPVVQRAALLTIAEREATLDDAAHDRLLRLLRRAREPAVRAAALEAARVLRLPESLAAIEPALRHADPASLAAATAVAVELGGGRHRERVAAHLAGAADGAALEAALERWRGPLPDVLRERLVDDVRNRRGSVTWQAAAGALALAEAPSAEAAAPLAAALSDLAHSTTAAEALEPALRALQRHAAPDGDDPLAPWLRIDAAADLPRLPARVLVLHRLEHPDTIRLAVRALADDRLGADERVALLRAWRSALLPTCDALALAAAPRAVRALLQP